MKQYQRILLKAVVITTVLFLSAMSLLTWTLPSQQELLSLELKRPARIWTQEGWLIGEIGEERRYPIAIEKIPPLLQQAFLSVEDARFYEHRGVDFKSLIRAFWVDIAAGKKIQGGSTISMQVARNFFLHRKKTYGRKFREILLAWRIEQYLSKEQILELYLNKIFLGHRNYGVVAAAQFYFGKSLDELTIGEMAILAGLPKAPSQLNPLYSLEKCTQRRNSVIQKMQQHGYISDNEADRAMEEPISSLSLSKITQLNDPNLLEYFRKELEQQAPESLRRGDDIRTTISGSLQKLAHQALDDGLISVLGTQKITSNLANTFPERWPAQLQPCEVLEHHGIKLKVRLNSGAILLITPRSEKIPEKDFVARYEELEEGQKLFYDEKSDRLLALTDLQGAVSILGPQGEVLALVGAASWSQSFFNRASETRRPIASTIKSLIFSQAFDQGYQLDDLVEDAPFVSTDKQGFQWRPHNHNHTYQGTLSIEQAFLRSANLATLRLSQGLELEELGKRLSDITQQPVAPLPESFALGSYECTPLELAQLYQAFNSQGLFPIRPQILSEQKVCWKRLCSEQSAYVTRYLQERFFHRLSPEKIRGCGGKTGTSNNFQDLWFAGYQNGLSCVVWVGYDQPRSTEIYAVRGAFPIWQKIATQSAIAFPGTKSPTLPSRIRLEKDGSVLKPVIIQVPESASRAQPSALLNVDKELFVARIHRGAQSAHDQLSSQ